MVARRAVISRLALYARTPYITKVEAKTRAKARDKFKLIQETALFALEILRSHSVYCKFANYLLLIW